MAHPKNELMEKTQQRGLGKPNFQTRQTGPAHEPTFISDVYVNKEVVGTGQGRTKREAEKQAATEGLHYFATQHVENAPAKDAPASTNNTKPERTNAAAQRTISAPDDEPFEGPWPIFPDVLSTSLNIANARVNPKLNGMKAVEAIRELALELYKGTLEDLGEVVEVLEDEDVS